MNVLPFNPTLVQFKLESSGFASGNFVSFNPTLVQFKQSEFFKTLNEMYDFQSYLSPI